MLTVTACHTLGCNSPLSGLAGLLSTGNGN